MNVYLVCLMFYIIYLIRIDRCINGDLIRIFLRKYFKVNDYKFYVYVFFIILYVIFDMVIFF